MTEPLVFRYDVDGGNFTSAGQASVQVKKNLRQLGIDPETIRRVSIAMYEGEINMVIHAGGGEAEVIVSDSSITIILKDCEYRAGDAGGLLNGARQYPLARLRRRHGSA